MRKQKRCPKCGEVRARREFGRNKRTPDGLQGWCKMCMNAKVAEWRSKNRGYKAPWRTPDAERAYSKKWRGKNPDKAKATARRTRELHPEIHREGRRRYRERHPAKAKAHAAVNNAIYRGKLFKPPHCEKCGEVTESQRLHAHHWDYSKPFEVEWLCLPCHREQHAEEEAT